MLDSDGGTGSPGSDGAVADAAPAGDSAAGLGGQGSGSDASAGSGHAPGAGDDATSGQGGQAAAAASPGPAAGAFTFAGRQFPSQAKAEEWAKSHVGRVPDLQRKVATYEQQLATQRDELDRATRALALRHAEGGQGGQSGKDAASGPKSWADELVDSGELEFIADLAETKGLGHAVYALAQQFDKRFQGALKEQLQGAVGPIQQRREFEEHVGRTLTAVRQLSSDYPELDESNQSPEAAEARDEIIRIWTSLPREFALGDPGEALRYAAFRYRNQHGTPTWAVPPATSGSPSAGVARAAERAGAVPDGAVLDGSGTPRQRPNGKPATRAEAFEKDLEDASRSRIAAPDGFDLGFRRVGAG